MADPTTSPQRLSAEGIAAIYAAKDAALLEHIKTLLDADSVVYLPDITYADALAALTLNYQNQLDAAGFPYDEYDSAVDYDPTTNAHRSYCNYLYNLVQIIPVPS